MNETAHQRRVLWIALALAVVMAALASWRALHPEKKTAGAKHRATASDVRPESATKSALLSVVKSPKSVEARTDTVKPPSRKAKQADLDAKERASAGEALDRTLANTDPINRSIEFGRLLRAWFERDPEGALAYLQKMPHGREYELGMRTVLGGLGQKDPQRALMLARDMATNSQQRAIYNLLFDQFARRDLKMAAGLLGLVPAGEARNNAVGALASRWSDADMDEALAWAQKLEHDEDRIPAMEAVLFPLADKDPWRAFTVAVQELDGDPLERTMTRVLQKLGTIDPQRAGDVVKMLPPGPSQTFAAMSVARTMAEQEPAEALDWIATLPEGDLHRHGLNNVLDVWVDEAPAKAGAYVAGMPAGPDQDFAAGHFAEQYATADPSAAVIWAARLPSETARRIAQVNAASGWARKDPAAATRWAANLDASNPGRLDAMNGALSYWVLADEKAACYFAQHLPAGETRETAIAALNKYLATKNRKIQ